jgi:hypothetical protein
MRFVIPLILAMVVASSGHADSRSQKRAEAVHQAHVRASKEALRTLAESKSLRAALATAKAAAAERPKSLQRDGERRSGD